MSIGAPEIGQPEPGTDGQPSRGFVLRLLLGAQLRRFRKAVDISPEQAGYEIRASRSRISRMETGHVGFKTRDIVTRGRVRGRSHGALRAHGCLHRDDNQVSVPAW